MLDNISLLSCPNSQSSVARKRRKSVLKSKPKTSSIQGGLKEPLTKKKRTVSVDSFKTVCVAKLSEPPCEKKTFSPNVERLNSDCVSQLVDIPGFPINLDQPLKKLQVRYDPEIPMSKDQTTVWRRDQRRKRNRESAAASRERQRNRISELETEVAGWKIKFDEANARLTRLEEKRRKMLTLRENCDTSSSRINSAIVNSHASNHQSLNDVVTTTTEALAIVDMNDVQTVKQVDTPKSNIISSDDIKSEIISSDDIKSETLSYDRSNNPHHEEIKNGQTPVPILHEVSPCPSPCLSPCPSPHPSPVVSSSIFLSLPPFEPCCSSLELDLLQPPDVKTVKEKMHLIEMIPRPAVKITGANSFTPLQDVLDDVENDIFPDSYSSTCDKKSDISCLDSFSLDELEHDADEFGNFLLDAAQWL